MQQPPMGYANVILPSRGFPFQLFALLEQVEDDGMTDVISWRSHGYAFKVHRKEQFVESVLPQWFRHTKFSSFQRQLSIYGFRRIPEGRDKDSYYHKNFLRGHFEQTILIGRNAIKGTRTQKATHPEWYPDFYKLARTNGNNPSNDSRSTSAAVNSSRSVTSDQLHIVLPPVWMTQGEITPSSTNPHQSSELDPELILNNIPLRGQLGIGAGLAATNSNGTSLLRTHHIINAVALPEIFPGSAAINPSNLNRTAVSSIDQNILNALLLQTRRSAPTSLTLPRRQPLDPNTADALLLELQQSTLSNDLITFLGRTVMDQRPLATLFSQQLISTPAPVTEARSQSQALIDFLQEQRQGRRSPA